MSITPMGKPGQFSDYPYDDVQVPSSTHPELNIAISIFSPSTDAEVPAEATSGSKPVIVMAHGIGAIRMAGLQHFAARFAQAGYFAVTLDYLFWGDSEGSPRNHMSVSQQLADYKDVISWVRTHATSASTISPTATTTATTTAAASPSYAWDPTRVVIWGTSFAGMHVTALLADDQQLAGGIAQCPCVDGFAAAMKLPKVHLLRLFPYIVSDQVKASLHRERVYIGLTDSGGPKGTALMPGPEAVQGKENIVRTTPGMSQEEMTELSDRLDKITARSALSVMLSRPITKAKRITAPFLVVLPEWDNQASLGAAEKAAKMAAKGEAIKVKGGHFDIYYGCVGYEENIGGQLEFLKRVLG